MVKLLVGSPGSGKTKIMIERANEAAANAKGEIVYVDVVDKHTLMLDRKIRIVFTKDFQIDELSSLYGLICGIVSGNFDIEHIFIDGVDKIVRGKIDSVFVEFMEVLSEFSEKNGLDLTVSANIEDENILKQVEKYQ